jgi:WD40 repeat protein
MTQMNERAGTRFRIERAIAAIVVAGTMLGPFRLAAVRAGEKLAWLRTIDASEDKWIGTLSFSPDEKTVVGAALDAVVFWDVASGAERQRYKGAPGTVHAVAVSPDGKLVACGGLDKTVVLREAATGVRVGKFPAGNSITSLAFSADGKLLAVADMSRFHVWEIAPSRELVKSQGTSWILCVALSPDGKLVAYGSTAANFDVFDVSTGAPTRELNERTTARRGQHRGSIHAVAFSPTGKLLATASEDHAIILWELATGRITATLTGHADEVNSISFSPDGGRLASGSKDQTVRLWDVRSGETVAVAREMTEPVQSVTLGPKGSLLAAAGARGTLMFWKIGTTVEEDP